MAPLGQIHVRGRPLGDGVAPLIITPLIGRKPQALADELKVILPKRPDMLKWRVDHSDDIGDGPRVVAAAREVLRAAGALPLLLTRRHHREGGQPIAIDEAAVLAMNAAACEAGCVDLIDYEMSNAPADLARLRAVATAQGVTLVLSYHDFDQPPPSTPWWRSSCWPRNRVPKWPRWP